MAGETKSLSLDRGETARLVICASELDPDYRIVGLDSADIEISYQQYLARCSFEDGAPGLHLKLSAGPRAVSATLDVMGDNAQIVASLSIEVPERELLSDALLNDIGLADQQFYLLEIRSKNDLNLSNVGTDDLVFPRGPWPNFKIVSSDDFAEHEALSKTLSAAFTSSQNELKAIVQADGEQRLPGKVIIRNIMGRNAAVEAVANVSLPPPVWANSMASDTSKYVDIDGIRTRYFEKGSGDPMLLVHGGQAGSAGFAAWSWMPNFDALSKSFRVIALDRIGQGYTDNPKSDAAYGNYYQTVVDHVFGLIEALDLKSIHLVGHSQGGWPVTRIALDHPELVKSLTIVDSATAAPADRERGSVNFYGYLSRFIHPPEGETAESVLRELNMYSFTGNNITATQIARLLKLAKLPKMEDARAQLVQKRMNPAHPTYRVLKTTLLNDIEEGKLKVPTLIIWGRNDPEGSYGSGVKLYELMSTHSNNVQLHTFENAGHLPSKEYPGEFNRLVESFAREAK